MYLLEIEERRKKKIEKKVGFRKKKFWLDTEMDFGFCPPINQFRKADNRIQLRVYCPNLYTVPFCEDRQLHRENCRTQCHDSNVPLNRTNFQNLSNDWKLLLWKYFIDNCKNKYQLDNKESKSFHLRKNHIRCKYSQSVGV